MTRTMMGWCRVGNAPITPGTLYTTNDTIWCYRDPGSAIQHGSGEGLCYGECRGVGSANIANPFSCSGFRVRWSCEWEPKIRVGLLTELGLETREDFGALVVGLTRGGRDLALHQHYAATYWRRLALDAPPHDLAHLHGVASALAAPYPNGTEVALERWHCALRARLPNATRWFDQWCREVLGYGAA